ncbi:MAG: GDSL-type esterase/lipase family protein, partial [Novosphingobium sp.]
PPDREGDSMARMLKHLLPIMLVLGSGPVLAQEEPDACADVVELDGSAAAQFRAMVLEPGRTFGIRDIPPASPARLEYLKMVEEQQKKDWSNLCRYREENAAVLKAGPRPRVIFLGDSITENWKAADPAFFSHATLDRGISGQTTPQILLRMFPDVIRLRPRAVHILAGTNDVSGATGPATDDMIVDNLTAMIQLAKTNGIRVVLAAITPTNGYALRPNGLNPALRIAGLNARLRQLAAKEQVTFLDYSPVLAATDGGLKPELSNDRLHPNRAGYALMRPLAERAITQALR